MAVAAEARKALGLDELDLPAAPEVLGIEVEEYVDWSGDQALRVYVILSDDADEASLTGENMLQLKRAIHQRLLAHGIDLFPYVFLRTESERREEAADRQGQADA